MALIAISGLRRYYLMGNTIVKAIDGVDLTIDEGEFLCLMGPSGSGKSTLLNLLGGLDSPDEGSIVVGGREITKLDENGLAAYRQKQIGFVFQSYNLIQAGKGSSPVNRGGAWGSPGSQAHRDVRWAAAAGCRCAQHG
jgi:putative ABC transport system ATP-binding protein